MSVAAVCLSCIYWFLANIFFDLAMRFSVKGEQVIGKL